MTKQPRKADTVQTVTPAPKQGAAPPEWKPRVLALESSLARAAQWGGDAHAETLLSLVRAMVEVRAIRLLDRAERLSAAVLSGEGNQTLVRARLAAFQADLGRAAEAG